MSSPDRIYDVGYRKMSDRSRPRRPAWAIARTMLVLAWRKRSTKVALLCCAGVALVAGVAVVVQLLTQRALGATPGLDIGKLVGGTQETLAGFVSVQFYFTAFAIAVVAGGAVADDRAAGAFDLYFARPLTRMDYALGKLLGAGLVPGVTLLVPVALLWLIAVGIAPPGLREQMWWLVVPALGGAALASAVLASTIVGVSAFGTSARGVGIAYITLLVGAGAVGEGIAQAGWDAFGYLSPSRDLRTVSDALLQVGAPSVLLQTLTKSTLNPNAALSALALLGFTGAGLGALWKRLGDEVVG